MSVSVGVCIYQDETAGILAPHCVIASTYSCYTRRRLRSSTPNRRNTHHNALTLPFIRVRPSGRFHLSRPNRRNTRATLRQRYHVLNLYRSDTFLSSHACFLVAFACFFSRLLLFFNRLLVFLVVLLLFFTRVHFVFLVVFCFFSRYVGCHCLHVSNVWMMRVPSNCFSKRWQSCSMNLHEQKLWQICWFLSRSETRRRLEFKIHEAFCKNDQVLIIATHRKNFDWIISISIHFVFRL